MKHTIVHSTPGMYAGWPANHGAWQWGDELLVGFLRGRYGRSSMHNIREPLEKLLARSLDGGETWALERPNVDFEARTVSEAPPAFDLKNTILRACGVYDTGGDECDPCGGFYLSHDRGKLWQGPYAFAGLEAQFEEPYQCTARTDVLPTLNLVMLSRAKRHHWGTDSVFCAHHDGERFRFLAWVCDDTARAVMPASAMVGGRIVTVARRRQLKKRAGWIDAFGSDDLGQSWRHLSNAGVTGPANGNPPALLALPDGRLICTYGDRATGRIVCRISEDLGNSWHADLIVLREDWGGRSKYFDVGYPRLFLRSDGQVACLYYYADAARPEQYIGCTIFAP